MSALGQIIGSRCEQSKSPIIKKLVNAADRHTAGSARLPVLYISPQCHIRYSVFLTLKHSSTLCRCHRMDPRRHPLQRYRVELTDAASPQEKAQDARCVSPRRTETSRRFLSILRNPLCESNSLSHCVPEKTNSLRRQGYIHERLSAQGSPPITNCPTPLRIQHSKPCPK